MLRGRNFRLRPGLPSRRCSFPIGTQKKGITSIFLRKEDGDRRILLALQNDRDVNNFAAPKVPPQPVLSFGLNLGGEYSELDMPLDGRDGRPSLAELTDGQTHHVAATYDSASGRKAIYFDGTLRFSRQLPQGTQIVSGGPCPLTIGSMFGGWETFSGTIDEVAIYRAASPTPKCQSIGPKFAPAMDISKCRRKPRGQTISESLARQQDIPLERHSTAAAE